MNKSAAIKILLKNIPIAREKPMKPLRYSFFQGLKKVLTIKGKEKISKNPRLISVKKLKMETGASRYQNFIIAKGSVNINLSVGDLTQKFKLSYSLIHFSSASADNASRFLKLLSLMLKLTSFPYFSKNFL